MTLSFWCLWVVKVWTSVPTCVKVTLQFLVIVVPVMIDFSVRSTIDKNLSVLSSGVHRSFRFSESVQLGVQRLVFGVHGPGSEKNFRVHRTRFPFWSTIKYLDRSFCVFPFCCCCAHLKKPTRSRWPICQDSVERSYYPWRPWSF